MNILDDLGQIKKLDKSNVLGSIDLFPNQCLQALEETEKLDIPSLQNKVRNIVVCGMGGSAFTPEIVKTLFSQEIRLPYELVRDYHLPAYVNMDSLVIISSYSGTTKEAISAGKKAIGLNSKILFICSKRKSELITLAQEKKLSGYIFEEKFNPCLQPRLGPGYTVCGHIGLLIKSGLVNISFNQVKKAVNVIKNNYKADVPLKKNQAKQMAVKLKDKFVFLTSSEFLNGAIHGFANQLNENAKTNSTYHYIPELNHHRMEGLKYPEEFKKIAVFLFYFSNLYDKRNKARYKITQDVIKKNDYQVLEYEAKGNDKVSQTFETIMFNSYVSFYLAMLNKVDPTKIPWVDYFKKKLKKLPNEKR